MKNNHVARSQGHKVTKSVCLCVMATLCFLFFTASAWAATYYVDPVNGNDGNAGTEAAPWKTIAKVAPSSVATDTIIIRNMNSSLTGTDWPQRTYRTNQISQFSITWTFNTDYRIGQFVNRDMWIIGPVNIVAIAPVTTVVGSRTMNGSSINPRSGTPSHGAGRGHGYDSGASGYSASLNVAVGISTTNPLIVSVGSSLVSTQSGDDSRTRLDSAAVLTVLSVVPPAGSFRPPFCGGINKSVMFNESDLDYSKLFRLPTVTGASSLATAAAWLERPWLDHVGEWSGAQIHPVATMPDYGRDMAKRTTEAALLLNLKWNEDIATDNNLKRLLLIRYVQLGIDNYFTATDGITALWVPNGGHATSRKLPILFAGAVFENSNMLAIGEKSGAYVHEQEDADGAPNPTGRGNPPTDYIHFGEDGQTQYVAQYNVDVTHSSSWAPDNRAAPVPYEQSDIGLPEWAIRAATAPTQDNKNWDTVYRTTSGCTFPGTALAALIMNLKTQWNNPAFFDYCDRYMVIEHDATGTNSPGTFVRNMWDAYRANYGRMYIGLDSATHQRIYSDSQDTILYGDVSGEGEVSAYDAALVAQAAVGLITLTAEQIQAADVSGEGEVSAYDAALIAQKAVGLINKFPVEG